MSCLKTVMPDIVIATRKEGSIGPGRFGDFHQIDVDIKERSSDVLGEENWTKVRDNGKKQQPIIEAQVRREVVVKNKYAVLDFKNDEDDV